MNNRKLERIRLNALTLQPPRKTLRIDQIRRKHSKRRGIIDVERGLLVDIGSGGFRVYWGEEQVPEMGLGFVLVCEGALDPIDVDWFVECQPGVDMA